MALTSESIPVLWRLARLDFDAVRQQHVLLYPEGAVLLNDTGHAILELCDGARTVTAIAEALKGKYQRDVSADVLAYLTQLTEGDFVREASTSR